MLTAVNTGRELAIYCSSFSAAVYDITLTSLLQAMLYRENIFTTPPHKLSRSRRAHGRRREDSAARSPTALMTARWRELEWPPRHAIISLFRIHTFFLLGHDIMPLPHSAHMPYATRRRIARGRAAPRRQIVPQRARAYTGVPLSETDLFPVKDWGLMIERCDAMKNNGRWQCRHFIRASGLMLERARA